MVKEDKCRYENISKKLKQNYDYINIKTSTVT